MGKFLTALPVYNEAEHVASVLDQVTRYSPEVLVVDDGSTDDTPRLLAARNDIRLVRHDENLGYGAALRSAFDYAVENAFEILVTIDCDGQHEPQRISEFVAAFAPETESECRPDIISGSRYLGGLPRDAAPPIERRRINLQIAEELNARLGLKLTDAFCGFKAYRVAVLPKLTTRETGYGMPLELWVKAALAGLHIVEMPVPLIYLDEKRSFGGELDDGSTRLAYYHRVLDRSLDESAAQQAAAKRKMLCGESTE